jgi:CO/xanthine dehydrogenase Mo-binding subunit
VPEKNFNDQSARCSTRGAVAQNIGDTEKAMEPMNCTVHLRKDGCEIWVGSQAMARVQAAAAKTAGPPLDKVVVHNHLIGGGFGRPRRDRSSFI